MRRLPQRYRDRVVACDHSYGNSKPSWLVSMRSERLRLTG